MLDVQRERLRHMLANAILELWKKETGSLTSVIIEGTICITSGTGKTTVVQVADKFQGGIPDISGSEGSHDDSSGFFDSEASLNAGLKYSKSDHYTLHSTPPARHSSQRFISRDSSVYNYYRRQTSSNHAAQEEHTGEPIVLSGKRRLSHDEVEHSSPRQAKEQALGPDERVADAAEVKVDDKENHAGAVCPGTGYYTCKSPRASSEKGCEWQRSENSDSEDSDLEEMGGHPESGIQIITSTPINARKLGKGVEVLRHDVDAELTEDGVVDLSRKESDLALSSPYSYTEQVRGVIRERLMRASESSTPTPTSELEGQPRSITPPAYMSSISVPAHRRSFSQSWPGAMRDKHAFSSALFSPGSHHLPSAPGFTSPLTIGLPGMPGYVPSSSAASPNMMFPFPPRHGISPVSPLHDILKPPRASPCLSQSPDETSSPVFPSPTPTGKSSPDLADVNGNTEKDPTTGEQKIYSCEFCKKTFLFKSKYHEHLPVHTNARPFQCHMCSRTYKYKYDLRVHLRTHLGIPTKSTICPFCSAKFSTNKVLRVHIQDAHQERQRASDDNLSQVTSGELTPAI